MKLGDGIIWTGRVRVRGHPPGYEYARSTYKRGRVLHDDHNGIDPAGLALLGALLMAAPAPAVGITQMEVLAAGVSQAKLPLTDQYASGGQVVNVLYLSTTQPPTQPVTLESVNLYAGAGGSARLAFATLGSIGKTTTLAVTIEWTVTLSGV